MGKQHVTVNIEVIEYFSACTTIKELHISCASCVQKCELFVNDLIFVCSDAVAVKQSQVDKLYASLKDLAGERRGKLDEVLKLYMLNREIEDIEQWIAEREVVAGSHELGQDFEHVTVVYQTYRGHKH